LIQLNGGSREAEAPVLRGIWKLRMAHRGGELDERIYVSVFHR
jgi:hypothetical protein